MHVYPLLMTPYFRHGQETPWGGHALREQYGKPAPADGTGESLEISALPGMESRAANGPLVGKGLAEIAELWGEALTGSRDKTFPLLLKLLDARDFLSVQVHPGDDFALAHDGKLGKSEAWYILNAKPGAKIVYGVDTQGKPLRDIVAAGELESCLHWAEARPGDVFYLPHGMIHALGPGIQCYEIQQSSDATYRFWDWGRMGSDGRPRALHTEKALAVSNPDCHLSAVRDSGNPENGVSKTLLVDDPHFRLYSVAFAGSFPLEEGRMQFLTPLQPCTVKWEEQSLFVKAFQSVLIPAQLTGASVSGQGKILLSVCPNSAVHC